jgi:hypothetical protein
MKRNILLGLVTYAILVGSCKSTAPVGTKKNETATEKEIPLPFSGSEYESNSEFIRERASGKSKFDLETASADAVLQANGKIASDVEQLIKNFSESITNKLQINDREEFSKELSNRLLSVTKLYLKNTKTIAEKALKSSDGFTTYWVVRELSIKSIVDEAINTISNDQKANQIIKKEEIRKIANEEIEKMEREKKK